MLFDAKKQNITAEECIDLYKKKWEPIPWIGHKIKSKYNPDTRCQILYEIIEKFPSKSYFNFALAVENLTLEKKSSLILNIDWYIAAALLDMMISMWLSHDEIAMYIKSWLCNWIFIAARTLWFIWHHIDQNRLHEWLYRTPENDILYL